MRFFKILISVVFLVTCVFFVYVSISTRRDYTAPVLTCDTDTLEISVNEDPSVLLTHVTASDEQDGDLTKQVIVESISAFIHENRAQVIFAVCDSDSNVAKLTVDLIYSDYSLPVFSIAKQQTYYVGAARADLLSGITASDMLEGDISPRIVVTDSALDLSQPGVYPVTYSVTSAKGATSEITINAYVYEQKLPNSIALKQYLVYTDVNKKIDAKSFISSYPADYLQKDYFSGYTCTLEVSDETDYTKPGTYSITYRLVKKSNTDAAQSEILAESYLTVIVRGNS